MNDALQRRDLPALDKALQEVVRRADLTFAHFAQAAKRRDELHASIAAAKGRASLGEEMQRQLEALQHRAHERSVGAFERLLTAILHDVLPGEGQVRFDLAMKNNSTWLDILLEKGGHLESALEGNGGAVANVLSTGLRFAALSRTKNRRLLVLDEPDCWVKPERIPAFVNVIARVSQTSKFQTFFISHHETDLFEAAVNVIELGRNTAGKVYVKAQSHVGADWADDEQPGIRAIELHNVRQHESTVLRFFPGATALVGPNNLGKSTAIHSALKAVAYGESSDDLIRHGCDEATIVLHLEKNKRIVWSRKLKRSPVVLYKLYQGDELIAEGRPGKRGEAPQWVVDELGITPVDELDVQLRNQKKPVFLLDDTASRRAQVLSIGRESGYLKELLAEYDAIKTEDRETIRQGEAEYARIQWRLRSKETADTLPELSQRVHAAMADLKSRQLALAALQDELSRLDARTTRNARARSALATVPGAPCRPTAVDPTACGELAAAIARGSDAAARRLALPAGLVKPTAVSPAQYQGLLAAITRGAALRGVKINAQPVLPSPVAPAEIARLGAAIRRGFTLEAIAGKMALSATSPKIAAPSELQSSVAVLQKAAANMAGLRKEASTIEGEQAVLSAEEQALRQALGDQCPVCGSHLPEQGFKHVH